MPTSSHTRAPHITVTTAVDMDDELRAKVRAKVNSLFGADALIDEVVSPVILGGIVIEGAGQRYDASVRAQLASIRTSLASAYAGGEE